MSLPPLTPFASELYYQRTAPLAYQDATNDYAWAVLCAALATMFDPYEFVRDSPAGPGYSSLLDLDRAPAGALGWLAMFAGVRTIPSLTDAQQRARIDATDGFQRGTPAAIIAAAQSHLTGTRRVSLFERDGGDPYALRVVTYAAETPSPAQTVADIVAAKPVGLMLTVQVLVGWIISEMETFYMGSTIASGPEAGYASIAAFESRVS
ncbi:MAG: LamG domain protein jellyroll fold domain protein [Solirubrobacterales bacterium]|nr:LamG domain protein jellyroll fold domain protein [Solirubrobacterales bacterium]